MKISPIATQFVALLACSISYPETIHAFLPQDSIGNAFHRNFQNVNPSQSLLSTRLYNAQGNTNEEALREELALKNEKIEDEAKYGIRESENLDIIDDIMTEEKEEGKEEQPTKVDTTVVASKAEETESDEIVTTTELTTLQKKMKRICQPRAYPLFILEKASLVFEDFAKDISKVFTDPDDTKGNSASSGDRKKVVVLGCGWGAAAFLKEIDVEKFDVTVISPRNFFLFTPMLAGASVGSVDFRSITEPVREINPDANFLEATATEIDPKEGKILCESIVCAGNSCTIKDFSVDYDYIIYTVGAQTNTFGIPGVREYCCFLKQVEDASRIRTALVNCFERANLPDLLDSERESILTFCIIGAGPTGIEFASELRDFVEQDGPKYYPKLLKHVRIKVIEASSTVLAPFDKSLQAAAIEQLTRAVSVKDKEVLKLLPEKFLLTELLLDSGVQEVKEDVICLNNGDEIPYGISVWAAGNGPLPITLQTIDALSSLSGKQSEVQPMARGRIAVDPWLRALGGDGKVLALGDCAVNIDSPLPATAQVASQQGEYLARLMSQTDLETDKSQIDGNMLPPMKHREGRKEALSEMIAGLAMNDGEVAAPFQFLNLGILAYTGGGSALAQVQVVPNEKGTLKGKGKLGFGLWRSVYLSKQVSWRNRFLVATDWVKTQVFGRDITRM